MTYLQQCTTQNVIAPGYLVNCIPESLFYYFDVLKLSHKYLLAGISEAILIFPKGSLFYHADYTLMFAYEQEGTLLEHISNSTRNRMMATM